MRLFSLLSCLLEKEVFGYKDLEIEDITDSSRNIKKGSLFVAIKGERFDGHSFIQDAIARGVSSFVVEDRRYITPERTFILVPSSRRALSQLAGAFFGNPTDSLNIIGITGTNGKTTTVCLIEEIFKKAGFPIARFSTIGHRIANEDIPTFLTTPPPLEIHRLLLKAKNSGIKFVVMEVSSHALSLDRVFGIRFSSAIFTNLSQDHLDFHKSFENYLSSKRSLFLSLDKEAKAFVNIDSLFYKDIIKGTRARVITYGIENDCEIKAERIENGKDGISFFLGNKRIETKLYGRYNVYNCLAAISCAINYGISFNVIKEALAEFKPPAGRFEIIWKNPLVVIDYAHTPDGLANVLKAGWSLKPKRIILLFGCGGNREKEKRPIMGSIADELASLTIITSDNPRDEDSESIMDEIEKGMRKPHLRIGDRREAIKKAIELADYDDLILLAGKGHEEYQIIGNRRIPFNDKEVALGIIQNSKFQN